MSGLGHILSWSPCNLICFYSIERMARPLSNKQRSISLLPEPPVLRQSVLFARGSTRSGPFGRGSTNISMRRTCKRLTCTYHGTQNSARFATPYLEHPEPVQDQRQFTEEEEEGSKLRRPSDSLGGIINLVHHNKKHHTI